MNSRQRPLQPPRNRKTFVSRGAIAGLVIGSVLWFVAVRTKVGALLGYSGGFNVPLIGIAALWEAAWGGVGAGVGWLLNRRSE